MEENASKQQKQGCEESDEIVKVLLKMECSNVEIQSLVDVGGGPRLKKIRKRNMKENDEEAVESMKGLRKPAKYAASAEAIDRIVYHMTNSMIFHDVQGTDVQLMVLGKNQSATWSKR